ncbi:MAG: hypothetical protein FWC11_01280 [Firmicutes bacterium]|nr:hypothetical protein [Bacillota bacterium]
MKNKILKILLTLVIMTSFILVATACGGSPYSRAENGDFIFRGRVYVADWLETNEQIEARQTVITSHFAGTVLRVVVDEENMREGDATVIWTNRAGPGWGNIRIEEYNDVYRPINIIQGGIIDDPSEEGMTAGDWHIRELKFYENDLIITISFVELRHINGEDRRVVFAEFELVFEQ